MPTLPLFLSDAQLLQQCRLDTYRGSGPGGQKRNKTANAVRLTHLPTKLAVTATESRSLALNKLHALRRLRLKLATHQRQPVDLLHFAPPDWFVPLRHDRALPISHRPPRYAPPAGLILDLLQALHGNPAAVAVNLGLSTSAIIKFLEAEPQLWTAANDIRAALAMPPLTHRR
jgi:hypothetical protein